MREREHHSSPIPPPPPRRKVGEPQVLIAVGAETVSTDLGLLAAARMSTRVI